MNIKTISLGTQDAWLDCYLPAFSKEMPASTARPAVLIFPGGGYFYCSDREAEPVALAFLGEGFAAFVLRYSTGGEVTFEEQLHEAAAALRLISVRAASWFVNSAQIAVLGFSAGGHLAAALGTMGKQRPAALILGYPCILDSIGGILAHPIPNLSSKVDANTPPTFLFATRNDAVVPVENTLAFASALVLAGVSFELHIYRHGNHGLSLAKPHTAGEDPASQNAAVANWFTLCANWLRAVLLEGGQ